MGSMMNDQGLSLSVIGHVVCPPNRPATAREVWIDLLSTADIALNDLLVIHHHQQRVLGMVIDIQKIDPSRSLFTLDSSIQLSLAPTISVRTFAKLRILSVISRSALFLTKSMFLLV